MAPNSQHRVGGQFVIRSDALRNRCELEEKMAIVFGSEIGEFSTELQKILIDDLVTAFESRVNLLNRIQTGRRSR
jgi:hypothetical protein